LGPNIVHLIGRGVKISLSLHLQPVFKIDLVFQKVFAQGHLMKLRPGYPVP
jgi:hypothetical protein